MVDSWDVADGEIIGCSDSGTASASAGPCTWTAGGNTYSGRGSAHAGFASFSGSASLNGYANAGSWVGARAVIESYDYFKFAGPSGAYLQFIYDVTGNATGTGFATLYASWNLNTVASGLFTTDGTATSVLLPFVPGVEYSLYQQFHVFTGAEVAVGQDISGMADFSHTVVLRPFRVTDAAGNPLSGFSVESASGYDYLNGVSVPEASSLMLFSIGGAMLAAAARLRR